MLSMWLDRQVKYFKDLTQKNYRPNSGIPGSNLWNKVCPGQHCSLWDSVEYKNSIATDIPLASTA